MMRDSDPRPLDAADLAMLLDAWGQVTDEAENEMEEALEELQDIGDDPADEEERAEALEAYEEKRDEFAKAQALLVRLRALHRKKAGQESRERTREQVRRERREQVIRGHLEGTDGGPDTGKGEGNP